MGNLGLAVARITNPVNELVLRRKATAGVKLSILAAPKDRRTKESAYLVPF